MKNSYKPNDGGFPSFYQSYIDTLEDLPLIECLEKESKYAKEVFEQIPIEKADFKYAPRKWSVKQVLMHIIDTEVVFGYRGLAIARGESQELPGFDQNDYMSEVSEDKMNLKDLVSCYNNLRKANIALYKMLRDQDLDKNGIASGYEVSARTLGYFIAGHCRYHVNILKERYGI